MIYNLGMNLGLSVTDIDKMTIGMLIDLAYYRSNQIEDRKSRQEDEKRSATQADYDNF